MDGIKEKQVKMHKDLLDKCKFAIENGFYFEAILLEYAAIEGRLEVILGILGLPCNKDLPKNIRKKIKIGNRITCIDNCRKQTHNFQNSHLEQNFFTDQGTLHSWTNRRNVYVHGLLKSAEEYESRKSESKVIAEQGYDITKKLYNEAKRLRRVVKNHPDRLENCSCVCKKCIKYLNEER